tara:strand:+ start:265 stop:1161 length:897 start_codon:yes stop_codon:yes gene_type:complete
MKILIAGGTGLIGTRLVNSLRLQNHEVVILSRNPENFRNKFSNNVHLVSWESNDKVLLENIDAVIKLSGESVAQLWTNKVKKKILNSRTDLSNNLLEFLERNQANCKIIINASAIGFYSKKSMSYNSNVDENSDHGDSFLSYVCQKNEESCDIFTEKGIRVVHLRIGMVLTKNFSLLIGLSTLFSIPIPGKKNHYFPWVHLDDVIGFINHALMNDIHGSFNIISPKPLTHYEFYRTIQKHYNSLIPWILFIPIPIVKFIGDMSEMLLYGPKTLATRTIKSGYLFKFSNLDEALADLDK